MADVDIVDKGSLRLGDWGVGRRQIFLDENPVATHGVLPSGDSRSQGSQELNMSKLCGRRLDLTIFRSITLHQRSP